jgi:ABC-type multidrug transport system permease subunit
MFCVAVPAFTMPMIMFSGLLYKRDSAPPYLAWMEKISIVNYTFSALLVQQVGLS